MSESRADGVRVACPLFQAEGSGAIPTSALSLRIEVMSFGDAKALNRLWHSRLPRFGTGAIKNMPFLSYGAECGGIWYAAAIWSNPVARLLPQQTWLELRRLAIAPEAPKNTASRMLAIMAKLIRRARPEVERLISYQDTEVHTGGIYKAAGWTPTTVSGSGDWNRPHSTNASGTPRTRPKAQSEAPKQRWEKVLYERTSEVGVDATEPAGTETNLSLPERAQGGTGERDAPTRPSLWDASTDDE